MAGKYRGGSDWAEVDELVLDQQAKMKQMTALRELDRQKAVLSGSSMYR